MSACSSSYEPQQTASPLHTSEITENSSVQPDNSRPDFPAGYNMNVLYPTFTQAIVTGEKLYTEPSIEAKHVNMYPLENAYCIVLAECVSSVPEDWAGSSGYQNGDKWLLVTYQVDGLPLSDMG